MSELVGGDGYGDRGRPSSGNDGGGGKDPKSGVGTHSGAVLLPVWEVG